MQITYRFLSRAAKVHVNEAKQMLYRFHASRAPGTIRAVYAITGDRKVERRVMRRLRRRNWDKEEGGAEEQDGARAEANAEQEGGSGVGGENGWGKEDQDMVKKKRVSFAPAAEVIEDTDMDINSYAGPPLVATYIELVEDDRVDGWFPFPPYLMCWGMADT